MAGAPTSTRKHAPRPGVSVVVPFYGNRPAALRTLAALGRLNLVEGDELIVADNTPERIFAGVAVESAVRVEAASIERSSYHARNVGAAVASNDWLLFLDADCLPSRTLPDDYFSRPLEEGCGVVVGGVQAAHEQTAAIARYARSRGHLDQAFHVNHPYRPSGATANMLVRRAAWYQVGGFQEGIRSGADVEFCWRLQDEGWDLAYRPEAKVEHVHRERLAPLLRQSARHWAGNAWVQRRYPGSTAPPRVARELIRCAAGVPVWLLRRDRERALFKAIDGASTLAAAGGWLLSNRAHGRAARPPSAPPRSLVVMTDLFPALSESFIANEVLALQRLGWTVRVEASARAPRPDRSAARQLRAHYLEDDGIAAKARDLGWLVARHPLRCLEDFSSRRRWSAEERVWPLRSLASVARRLAAGGERHIHVHFAGPAALNALRLSRLVGCTYSVTAHAYDIYRTPANLREKLEEADFATSGCDYTVSDLRALIGDRHAKQVHKVVMGVELERFCRQRPHPATRNVLAVGRLVDKKGFCHLVEATALLDRAGQVERVTIVGNGPLREELETLIADRGVERLVTLVGALDPVAVRGLLEESAVLAMPCVVADDGDRDSMPVVVKEALAMEVPVVASDEVGLPEVVRPSWGRLVPPADPVALASAMSELLELSPGRRAAMGQAGRAFVADRGNLARETERLAALIEKVIP